jgi:hypothetical protein
MEKLKPRCIICGEEKEGLNIKIDNIVTTIRWINSHTIRAKSRGRPVVCRECFPKYYKARKSYEKKLVSYLIIGILFAIFIIVASRARPSSFLFGFAIIVFMFLLSIISYVPSVETKAAGAARQAKTSQTNGYKRGRHKT